MQSVQSHSLPIPVAQVSVGERMAFLKKVYGLLSLSLILSASAAWVTVSNEAFLMTVASNQMLFFIGAIASIFFVHWARKKETMGIVALFSFTILIGVSTAPIMLVYTGQTVINAAVLTGLVFASLSLYTITSKRDFSFMGGMLTVGLVILIVGGLLNAFIFQSSIGSYLYSAGGVFLFSGFIIYDTFNIMRRYPTDEHVSATLSLYLDILNLFMMLLHLIGGNKD